MKRWYMIIDVAKCENCNNCFLSCKDEHCGNEWPGYSVSQPLHGHRWMNIHRKERGSFPIIDVAYRPSPCMHCDDPPCRQAAHDQAVVRRDDGIVLIDPERSRGQRELVKSCPYGAIWWNEEKQVPQKCSFCAHLLDTGWVEPRCVQSCPTAALSFLYMEEEEMKGMVQESMLECIGSTLQASVLYKNLHRYSTCFIAGSVAKREKGRADCVTGAAVKLFQENSLLASAESDHFGDFKFDGIQGDSGKYTVEIEAAGFDRKTIEVEVSKSCSLGTIWL